MALFGIGKDKKKKAQEASVSSEKPAKQTTSKAAAVQAPEKAAGNSTSKKKPVAHVSTARSQSLAHVLKNPRVTEKATVASERGAYVFDVAPRATKNHIARAVTAYYKVVPRKINIVTIPVKRVRSRLRGRFGVVSGGKKAYVYLKKGDTIELV